MKLQSLLLHCSVFIYVFRLSNLRNTTPRIVQRLIRYDHEFLEGWPPGTFFFRATDEVGVSYMALFSLHWARTCDRNRTSSINFVTQDTFFLSVCRAKLRAWESEG